MRFNFAFVAVVVTLLAHSRAEGETGLAAITCENDNVLIESGQTEGLLVFKFKQSGTTITFQCDGPARCISVKRAKYIGTNILVLGIEPDTPESWRYSLASVDPDNETGTVYSKPINCILQRD